MREVLLIWLGIVGMLRLLYQSRHVPWIGAHLSSWAALAMVYPPLLHVWLRRVSIKFFEGSWTDLRSSLKILLLTSLILAPPFLVGNHLYQKILFTRTLGHLTSPPHFGELILVQLFLVALPEEFLFRGWLQPLISRSLPASRLPHLASPKTVAIVATAALFAISHSVIALRWWHFAIFFPSLVFGWLREKTGCLTAPILFHAGSNVAVLWLQHLYR